jgi:hypothetical protein
MKYTMKPKVKEIADGLVSVLSSWDSVEAVCLNESAVVDTLDPYFALILDVYVSGPIPTAPARAAAYPEHVLFETSPTGTKDRFIRGDVPVRIEYKSSGRIEELVEIARRSGSDLWKIRDSGTYVFYRLSRNKPLFERGSWLRDVNASLSSVPDSFWVAMRSFYQSSMDHFLADLGAAIVREDQFHYLVSSASFIKFACSALFMENGEYEPSHRAFFSRVGELTTLPDDFSGRFESFLRPDSELPPARKYEIAKLIAKSIVML